MRIERFGRVLHTQVSRTPEEHRALQAERAKAHQELPGVIREKTKELEQVISKLDPLDVIANAALANSVIDPNKYKEYEFEGNPAFTEYLTLICLKKPQWHSEHRTVSGAEHELVDSVVREIFELTKFYYATEVADPERSEPPTLIDEMRFLAQTEQLIMRSPAYEHHLKEQLTDLFGPFDEWMSEAIGFTIAEAISMTEGIARWTRLQLSMRGSAAMKDMKALKRQARDARRGRLEDNNAPLELIKRLAALEEKDLLRETKSMLHGFLFFGLGDTLSFKGSELAEVTDVPLERATKFLDLFSMQFGEVPEDFCMPASPPELHGRPIVHADDSYLCPAAGGLLWALRPTLEAAMNPDNARAVHNDKRAWNRYSDARGKYLEEEVLRLLGGALRHAETHHQLKYRFPENPTDELELDGLVRFDRTLILLEGKAGVMKASARRGARASMLESIEDLVADAHEQALRARSYIDSVDAPEFRTRTGERIVLDKDSFDEVIMMTVTLDTLGVFPAIMHRIAELDLFSDDDLPWTIPITDLRVICELVEFPSQLVHYMRRRLRLSELGLTVRATDELDYFGHYLTEGLYFEEVSESEMPVLQLLSYTGQFDEYYMAEMGQRTKPTPRPRQKMLPEFRKLIMSLEDAHPPGYVTVVCALLDLDAKTRRMVVKQLAKRAAAAKKDGGIHDFTFFFEDARHGLTFMCSTLARAQEMRDKLTQYCLAKKYQGRYDSWVGVGCLAEDPTNIAMCTWTNQPWEHDEDLERLVAEMLPAESKYVHMKD